MKLVTVEDMAYCREKRAQAQREMLDKHQVPLVSFTLNVPGPQKTSPLLQRGFVWASETILGRLKGSGYAPFDIRYEKAFTGWELLCAVQGRGEEMKKALYPLEEQDAFGRLLDIDIIRPDGSKVSREDIGLAPRTCLLCDLPAAVCGRSRAHSVEELYGRVTEIVEEKILSLIARQVGEKAQLALLTEAAITPKPGLVDRDNQGAHRDMDFGTFLRSATALRPYFERCAREGAAWREETGLMQRLRTFGLIAQDDMFSATNGVNTHMGAIYGLGILCGAAGHLLWDSEEVSSDALLACAGRIAAREADSLTTLAQKGVQTGGVQQYLKYGLTGARGQAAEGFPAVKDIGLPALKEYLNKGHSLNDAGVYTLMRLIEKVYDSNVIRRGGMDKQRWIMDKAKEFNQKPALPLARGLDKAFIEENISPGGSADLLAFTLFVYWMSDASV